MISRTKDLVGQVEKLQGLITALNGKTIDVDVGGNALEQIGIIEDRLEALDNREITVLVNYKNVGGPDATAQQLVKEVLIPAANDIKPIIQPVIQQPVGSTGGGGSLAEKFQEVITTSAPDASATSREVNLVTASIEALSNALNNDETTFAQLRGSMLTAANAMREARNSTGELSDTSVLAAAAQQVLDEAMNGTGISAAAQKSALNAVTVAQRELAQQAKAVQLANNDDANSISVLSDELSKASDNTSRFTGVTLQNEAAIARAAAANDDANASIIRMQMALNALDMVTAKASGDSYTYNNTLNDTRALAATLGDTIVPLTRGMGGFNTAAKDGIPLWETGSGIFGAWNSHIQLFGGALTQIGIPAILATVGTIHILTDSILEIASTVIPAALAFGAFGLAAAGPVVDLYHHMTDLFTVTQALQQQMYPFTGDLSKLQAAIKPEVYVLFGEALYTMGKNTGVFSELAKGAGTVLDQLGARITYALTSGDGFTLFLKNAVSDLAGWGTLIGNIGGIIGNLLKALPGFGQAFLAVAVSVSHFAENLSAATIPLQRFLLIGHGLLLWLGLAGTAGAWAISGLLGGVATFAAKAATGLSGIPVIGTAVSSAFEKDRDCCRGVSLTCRGAGYLSLRLVLVFSHTIS